MGLADAQRHLRSPAALRVKAMVSVLAMLVSAA
jgi:hypothetical protein